MLCVTLQAFDLVTARAVADMPVLTELCLPFVRLGGQLVVAKIQTVDGITRTLTCPVVHL